MAPENVLARRSAALITVPLFMRVWTTWLLMGGKEMARLFRLGDAHMPNFSGSEWDHTRKFYIGIYRNLKVFSAFF